MARFVALSFSFVVPVVSAVNSSVGKTCNDRGGCDCNCGSGKPDYCKYPDDQSCCYACCCYAPPSPGPPSPPSPPGPPSPPAPADAYCPTEEDFGSDGGVSWHGNGWTITGGGGVHSKTTWNLNGGYVEFDMDTSAAYGGVNNNLYTTSPDSVQPRNECDIQGEGKPTCMEMDIIEMNGNCMAQSTVHTWPNHDGGCDKGGCGSTMRVGGKFHVKAEFSTGGWMTVLLNGQKNANYNPSPSQSSKDYVVKTMNSHGAQIQSSQWVGWVPGGDQCPGGGNLGGSRFSVSNLVVKGSVVQGPHPRKCGQMAANSTAFVV